MTAARLAHTNRRTTVTYIDDIRTALDSQTPGLAPELLDLYTLLALVQGPNVRLADIHDAWAIWRSRTRPDHRSIVPFNDLTPEVQALDQPYADAVARAVTGGQP
ncbi:hypothetical protein [Streptomyces sp. NPDC050704]|uniref:DUF7701 domain-containing protein n=1 Tax=Streptomyces sp. NPDC050704 TaxID=3157219 RepID=UPI0034499914